MANREKLIWREICEIQKSKKYKIEFFFIRENVPENIKRKKRQTKLKKTEKNTKLFFFNFLIWDEMGFLKKGDRNFIFRKFSRAISE